MKKYVCTICGYVYDEAAGIPDRGITPGTKWQDLPDDWICPLCGATKNEFIEQTTAEQGASKKIAAKKYQQEDLRELSRGELSALCSNLSKGCEKQYRSEEAALFSELSEYYQGKSGKEDISQFKVLSEMIEQDLESYTEANSFSQIQVDRGALRALVWGEKVSRILALLLSRYEQKGEALIENTSVYVCEICGFIYIGDEPPEICPVCKVPKMKLEKIDKEAI